MTDFRDPKAQINFPSESIKHQIVVKEALLNKNARHAPIPSRFSVFFGDLAGVGSVAEFYVCFDLEGRVEAPGFFAGGRDWFFVFL